LKENSPGPINLLFGQYRFEFEANDEISFAEFNGSAWRGLFGHALRKTVCVTGMPNCDNCLIASNCAYAYIFETSPGAEADRMKKYTTVPHPFVIKNPSQQLVNNGDHFHLDLTLIGKANQYLAYIVQTFIKAGKIGIKKDRGKFVAHTLSQFVNNQWVPVWTENDTRIKIQKNELQTIPPVPEKLKIDFVTPLKIMQQGKLVTAQNFTFSHLFHSLSRRISMLAYFHEDVDFELDFNALLEQADRVETLDKVMELVKWKRYSSRQNKVMEVNGIKGSITVKLENHPELWPFIWLGSQVHAGKLTSMGLGEYRIQSLASLPTEQGTGRGLQ
jgi:CRISPR-associated endoribonuclease Cas6